MIFSTHNNLATHGITTWLTAGGRHRQTTKARLRSSVSYGRFKSKLIDPYGVDASELTNVMNYFQLGESVNYSPKEKHSIVAGVSGIGYFPEMETIRGYKGNPAVSTQAVAKNKGIELALFANDEFEIKRKTFRSRSV